MIFGDEDEFDEDMAELYQEFIEDATGRFQIIKGCSFPADREQIAKESHKLKGSASNFGFSKVAGLLGRIENEIATISEADYAQSLASAEADFGASDQQVRVKYPALSS